MLKKLVILLLLFLLGSCGGGNSDSPSMLPDADNDGTPDINDAFPYDSTESVDSDNDGIGNNADDDDDNDGVVDDLDDQPLNKFVHTMPKPTNNTFVVEHLTSIQVIGKLSGTAQDNRAISCFIVSNSSIGTVSIADNSTCEFTYTGSVDTVNLLEEFFTFKVNDGFIDSSEVATVSLSISSDPLHIHQWHLSNTGQNNFSGNSGLIGEDININKVWAEGYKGLGIDIAIVDSGLEIVHEDLSDNIKTGKSYNYMDDTTDPTNSISTGDHGTSVAGLAASVGWNQKGGRGVAPKASLRGFNFLKTQKVSDHLAALGGADYAEDVDIFNLSYGSALEFDIAPSTQIENALLNGITSLRGGLGAIYVKSAGNGFKDANNRESGPSCRTIPISCRNTAMDPTSAFPYLIMVAASNALGSRASYSNSGSANWVTAPGGEYGFHPDYISSSTASRYQPGMMTTDQSTCSKGYTTYTQTNAFEENHPDNSNCNYTSRFNGTSSAAPVLSGVIALMLEANPNLSWRDIKHILATTSVQIDPNVQDTIVSIDGVNYIAEPSWSTNAAGYKFHNWFGFGRVDAYAAVVAAKSYVSGSLGAFDYTNKINQTLDISIPDNSITGSTIDILITDNLVIESVQLEVSITHPSIGELGIELISPSGTRSVLFNIRNSFYDESDFNNFKITSNAFYGENITGTWKCKVVDSLIGNTGTLNSCGLKFYGH